LFVMVAFALHVGRAAARGALDALAKPVDGLDA
jgi:hypothetical protein